MKTGFDDPDTWMTQLRVMCGPDAIDMIQRFKTILADHIDQSETVDIFDTIEIAVTRDEVGSWLLTCHEACEELGSEHPWFWPLWYVGVQVAEMYLKRDEISADPDMNAAYAYFWGSEQVMDEDDQ